MTDDQEIKQEAEKMTQFARRASEEMGEVIFGAALREYRAAIQEINSHSPTSTAIDVANVLMDQIEREADSTDETKEFYKAMILLAAFQLMDWVDEEFNITIELN